MLPSDLPESDGRTHPSLLLRLAEAADAAAWDRFAKLYTPLIHTWAVQAGLPTSEADDAVQDVFVLLLDKLRAFRYDPSFRFRGWLRVVVRNAIYKRLRRRQPALAGDALPEPETADGLVALIDREYHERLVQRALVVMRTDFQETTWRACWQTAAEGRSAADVAADLGMTPEAVAAAKFRVLMRLRQELEGLLDD